MRFTAPFLLLTWALLAPPATLGAALPADGGDPGKAYRAKIGYRTANDATGTATVHVAPGYKGIGSARLTNTADQWKTASVSFVRPPAEDQVEVRAVVDNTSVGEGNTVWVRSLTIVELIPPRK